jgi:hypothetical protein
MQSGYEKISLRLSLLVFTSALPCEEPYVLFSRAGLVRKPTIPVVVSGGSVMLSLVRTGKTYHLLLQWSYSGLKNQALKLLTSLWPSFVFETLSWLELRPAVCVDNREPPYSLRYYSTTATYLGTPLGCFCSRCAIICCVFEFALIPSRYVISVSIRRGIYYSAFLLTLARL